MILADSLTQQDNRTLLKLNSNLSPFKAAVFPLLSNKPELVDKAKSVFNDLIKHFPVTWDQRGNIGKRYASQDEIGTPFGITIDFDTLNDNTVTVRDRDTATQKRMSVDQLKDL